MRILILIFIILLIPVANSPVQADKLVSTDTVSSEFNPGYSPFSVYYNGNTIPYHLFSIFTLPDAEVTLTLESVPGRDLWINAGEGALQNTTIDSWIWKAPPTSGIYPVYITELATGYQTKLNMVVQVPRNNKKGEYLNGYRIGKYPRTPLNGNPSYLPPVGFVEVTHQNKDTWLTPHFKLSQFLCKQAGGYPKYVVLREELLIQLEYILEEVNRHGFRTDTFTVMSGYRTPYYNARIGNGRYSRHIYGDAVDIFIDTNPKNGMMDDLNGDGKIDREDARILFNIINSIQKEGHFDGGTGLYGKRPWRGPFVHVDTRGHRARWIQ